MALFGVNIDKSNTEALLKRATDTVSRAMTSRFEFKAMKQLFPQRPKTQEVTKRNLQLALTEYGATQVVPTEWVRPAIWTRQAGFTERKTRGKAKAKSGAKDTVSEVLAAQFGASV